MALTDLFVSKAYAYTQEDFKIDIIPPGGTDMWGMISYVINIVLVVLGLVAVAYLIYGGVMFITSTGDSEKVTNARNTIMYAIIGIVIIVISFVLFNWAMALPNSATPK